MTMAQTNLAAGEAGTPPTAIAGYVHYGFEPDYVIQYYSREANDWRNWDCAHTRVEAENLLAIYMRRHRAEGREWRIAKIVYDCSEAVVAASP